MKPARILVVEDEGVVAADIEECLKKLGYSVVASAATAAAAIRKAVEKEPDLVLMDIRLKGPVDGVDAADELHHRLGIPVVFLTAYADAEILERAKRTCPSGYILKPFDERSLRSAIEIALHKHPLEQRLIASERRLVMALRSIHEAVILTDARGAVTLMNRPAEALTGWKQAEAAGRRVSDVFVSVHAARGSLLSDPVGRVLREGVGIGLGDHRVLVARNGNETWIRGSAVPLRDSDGKTIGAALVFHPADLSPAEPGSWPRTLEDRRLETAGRLAGEVAAGFTHELERIERAGAALLKRLGADTEARSAIETVLEAAARGSRLAGQLARYSRRRLPRPEVFDLNEAVAGLDSLLEAAAGETVGVVFAFDPSAGCVIADRGHLEHVLLNLASEAGHTMRQGGQLTIETRRLELSPEANGIVEGLAPGAYGAVVLSCPGGPAPAGDAKGDINDLIELIGLAGGRLRRVSEPGRLVGFEIYLPAAGGPAAS
jgi:PAS domain S-box-containing protein